MKVKVEVRVKTGVRPRPWKPTEAIASPHRTDNMECHVVFTQETISPRKHVSEDLFYESVITLTSSMCVCVINGLSANVLMVCILVKASSVLVAQAHSDAVMVLSRPARKGSNGVAQVCLRAMCSGPAGTGSGGTR